MNFIIASSWAQASNAAPTPQGTFMSFVPLIAIFLVFYFLMIRPQKKKMVEEKNFLDNLQKGDDVYTKSGVLGKIYGISDKIVTLEINEQTKIKILKTAIAGSQKELFATKPEVLPKSTAAKTTK
jgi:preprotein translocase subunit YajC